MYCRICSPCFKLPVYDTMSAKSRMIPCARRKIESRRAQGPIMPKSSSLCGHTEGATTVQLDVFRLRTTFNLYQPPQKSLFWNCRQAQYSDLSVVRSCRRRPWLTDSLTLMVNMSSLLQSRTWSSARGHQEAVQM